MDAAFLRSAGVYSRGYSEVSWNLYVDDLPLWNPPLREEQNLGGTDFIPIFSMPFFRDRRRPDLRSKAAITPLLLFWEPFGEDQRARFVSPSGDGDSRIT